MGAATVVMAGELELPETVKGIIADCAFTSPYDVFKHVLNSWYHLPSFQLMQISNLYCRVFAGYGYKDADAAGAAASVHKKLVIVDNAYHAESYFTDMERYRREFTDFINETKN